MHLALEPRHVSWLNLPEQIEWLRVHQENGAQFCYLVKPSPELARAALLEAVLQHIATGGSNYHAPRLIVEAG